MTLFTVVVLPDGHALFTTTEPMSGEQTAWLTEQLDHWIKTDPPMWAVLMDTTVVRVESLDVDLDASEGRVQSPEGPS